MPEWRRPRETPTPASPPIRPVRAVPERGAPRRRRGHRRRGKRARLPARSEAPAKEATRDGAARNGTRKAGERAGARGGNPTAGTSGSLISGAMARHRPPREITGSRRRATSGSARRWSLDLESTGVAPRRGPGIRVVSSGVRHQPLPPGRTDGTGRTRTMSEQRASSREMVGREQALRGRRGPCHRRRVGRMGRAGRVVVIPTPASGGGAQLDRAPGSLASHAFARERDGGSAASVLEEEEVRGGTLGRDPSRPSKRERATGVAASGS